MFKQIKLKFAMSVTSILLGSASCILERLQYHCSGQTVATQRGLTNKDNVQDQQDSAAVAASYEDNVFFLGSKSRGRFLQGRWH